MTHCNHAFLFRPFMPTTHAFQFLSSHLLNFPHSSFTKNDIGIYLQGECKNITKNITIRRRARPYQPGKPLSQTIRSESGRPLFIFSASYKLACRCPGDDSWTTVSYIPTNMISSCSIFLGNENFYTWKRNKGTVLNPVALLLLEDEFTSRNFLLYIIIITQKKILRLTG